MIYRNMVEALQDNAFFKFKERWGVEPYEHHLKEWCENIGMGTNIIHCSLF